MAEKNIDIAGPRRTGLETPLGARTRRWPRPTPNPDAFGEATEGFARFMGTPQFILWMSIFCVLWLGWNSLAPNEWRFDSAAIGFTALTLVLSLQASYAAPLLLLAQNRQDDRDKVSLREDRNRAERNLADTEYLTRELAGLRIALQDVATRDFVRSEMRDAVAEMSDELKDQLREKVRKQVRAEILQKMDQDTDVEDATELSGAVPRKPKKKKNRPSREARERLEVDDDGAPTTTLAIIAAEEAGKSSTKDSPQHGKSKNDAPHDSNPKDTPSA